MGVDMAKRPALFLLLGFVSFFVFGLGCSSSKLKSRAYYTLSYTMADDGDETGEDGKGRVRLPVVLRVKEFDVELSYDRQQIVYRYSPYQLEFYNYDHWVAKPHRMLSELVYKHIKHEDRFQHVTRTVREALPDYELEALVRNIEEFDSDTEWFAHLAMTFRLVNYKTREVVWRYEFDRRKKVYTHEVIYVVRALSQIIDEEMVKIVKGVTKAVSDELNPTSSSPTRDETSPGDSSESSDDAPGANDG